MKYCTLGAFIAVQSLAPDITREELHPDLVHRTRVCCKAPVSAKEQGAAICCSLGDRAQNTSKQIRSIPQGLSSCYQLSRTSLIEGTNQTPKTL